MTLAEAVAGVMWVGMTAYVVFGGADFGAGFWDLVAGGPERGSDQRQLIEDVIGPVWETNHVWLIYVIVVMWTAFPAAYAAVASTMYIPLTGAAVGIILRGSGFAFRKAVEDIPTKRLFGAAFASSSVLTPFFLGTVAGGVASGRVPLGSAAGDLVRSWLNPTSLLGGTLAVAVCAYLAGTFLTVDAQRHQRQDLAEAFRARALAAALVAGALALAGIAVLRADAPVLYRGLVGRALPLTLASASAGIAALSLLWRRRYAAARVASTVAVVTVIWGWAVAQYPEMLVGQITIAEAAAGRATLQATLIVLVVGALLLIPSLIWLYVLFQRHPSATSDLVPQDPSQPV